MGGRVSTCAMASTCDGPPGNASFQGSYADCSASCTLEYFTFDSTLNTGNNCLCFEQNQCTTAVFLGDQGNNSVLYTLNDLVRCKIIVRYVVGAFHAREASLCIISVILNALAELFSLKHVLIETFIIYSCRTSLVRPSRSQRAT